MISSQAIIETDQIGRNVSIGEFAILRKGVVIEDDVIIHPYVLLEAGVHIGAGSEIFPWTLIGKTPKSGGATARELVFETETVIASGCILGPHAVIYYDVRVGSGTLVGDGASIREGCRVGSRCVIGRHVTLNYDITIGDGTKIMDHAWMAGNMKVGSGVFISGGVMTANDNQMGAQGYRAEHIVGPEIGDQVRIGAGAILLPRIRIGDHAVIAAGSVVTRDVEAHSFMMGTPARVVRRLI